MISKTNVNFKGVVADHFVNCVVESNGAVKDMQGMYLLLDHSSGEDKELRDASLEVMADLMRSDPGVCI